MRKFLTFLIALAAIVLGVCSPASAQGFNGGGFNVGLGPFASGGGYTGPGDVFTTSPLYWFSCARVYSSAGASTSTNMCDLVATASTGGYTAGQAVCTLRGTATGFVDLSAYCSNSVESGVTPATACGHATSCAVTKMYNLISPGTCDVVQATLASMPLLLFNSTPTGTLPAVQASGAVGTLQVSTCAAKSQPITFSGVIIRTSGTTSAPLIGNSGGVGMGFDTTGNAFVGAGTNLDLAAANSSWHAINALANGNGTSSAINVDGTDQAGAAGLAGTVANALRVARVSSLTGTVALAEVGIWNAATVSTDRGNLNTNQHSAANGYNF